MENDYFNGLNKKLFLNIPSSSKKILELGCANGLLGFAYKQKNPNIHWTGVDINENAIVKSGTKLDRVLLVNLNNEKLTNIFDKNEFDTVIIGDLLEHLLDPSTLMADLKNVMSENSNIVCCIPNMVNMQVIEKMITGDMSYDENGLLDKTHQRFFSVPSAFKLFLDNGFMPELVDSYDIQLEDSPFLRGLIHSANSIGIPSVNLMKNLSRYQMIIKAQKMENQIRIEKNCISSESITIIVQKSNLRKLNENIIKSPGLKEINAQIIIDEEGKCAAEIFESVKMLALNQWILLLSDSCYFPEGSGHLMMKKLGERVNSLAPIGFVGLTLTNDNKIKLSGLKITETELINCGANKDIIAMDDFGVILNKNSPLKIDPLLGWHNFATDLCIQAFLNDGLGNGEVIDIPIFLNKYDFDEKLQYLNSAEYLKKKWKMLPKIETMQGTIMN
jgi:ubiquinone/menaquinone biosynthesis C-methylase UbiE